jgi:peptidoglycan/LPS O-acetylase OafA/YrhL
LAEGLAGLKRALSKIPAVVLLGIVIFGFYLVDRDARFIFLFSWIVAALMANLLLSDSWLRRVLSYKCMTWIGRRSYGMYLVHGLVLASVQSVITPTNSFRQIVVILLTFTGAALVAAPIFHFVEEPARRYGKALIERKAVLKLNDSEETSAPANLSRVHAEPRGV